MIPSTRTPVTTRAVADAVASPLPAGSARTFALECATLVAAAVALYLLERGLAPPPRAAAVAVVTGGAVATLLIGLAGHASGSRRAGRIAAAVAGAAVLVPLPRALGLSLRTGLWPLVAAVGMFCVVVLLAVAVRRRSAAVTPVVAITAVVLGVAIVVAGMTASLAPDLHAPARLAGTTNLLAWSGAGAAGVLAVLAGLRRDRPLLRRVGLAFVAFAAAHAAGLGPGGPTGPLAASLYLTGVVATLGAGIPFLLSSRRPRPVRRSPLPRQRTGLG
ncbi:MAG: hypothetical protein OJJ54_20255 [Pseudonocardia sp.]|nr:hypothetical protein [Pseudonocardia sp.]